MGHRITAIGHDPLLGYVFGPANIATATLTNYLLQSFHIATGERGDYFRNHARTSLVLLRTKEKLLNEGLLYDGFFYPHLFTSPLYTGDLYLKRCG